MSDVNHSRMIPLHIADQAVAACDKEIAALKAEVQRLNSLIANTEHETARLKAQVERMTTAGDDLVEALLFEDGMSCKEIADWNAAKEGLAK